MATFQMKSLTSDELQNEPIEDGSLTAVEDQGTFAFDIDGKRISFNQIIIIGSNLDRLMIRIEQIEVPDNKLFYVQESKELWFWFEQNWILVNREGKSAYQVAKEHGFKGTEDDWLKSLVGMTGATGESAYDIAVKNGFEGTEVEWVQSLKGPRGYKGTTGSSSYVHIKWGTTLTPDELLSEPNDYMGIAVTREETPPTDAASYTWVRIKGDQGTQGSAANVPTNISAFTNDEGYVKSNALAEVATSGSYTDLKDKPSIPSLNNTVTSTSTTEAATANAAKTAYDKGVEALDTANTKTGEAEFDAYKVSNDIKVSQVESIAKGAGRAEVFPTVAELDAWLAVNENRSSLQPGYNFYIIDRDVPDYWWDGTQRQELETQKVDLSEYPKTSAVQALINLHANDPAVHITAAERTAWNAKAGMSVATTSADGLMSSTDKTKLNSIESGANKTVLNNTVTSTSTTEASTANAVKTAYDLASSKASTSVATTSVDGLMSKADKSKLDGIEANANKTTLNNTITSTSTTEAATANAVKTAYDKGAEALNTANEAATAVNDMYRTIFLRRLSGVL